MAKATYIDLIDTANEVKQKQTLSDELASLIQKIEESTDVNGGVEISIKRVNQPVIITASILVSTLTSKKTSTDTEIASILNKVTIDGK